MMKKFPQNFKEFMIINYSKLVANIKLSVSYFIFLLVWSLHLVLIDCLVETGAGSVGRSDLGSRIRYHPSDWGS